MATTPTRSDFLDACLNALRSAGVPFCISRNHQEFWQDGLSDVDMLVSPARLFEAVECLESAAQKSGYRLVSRTFFDNLCLVYHAPGEGFVRLDLDTAVRWRTRTLLEADAVLSAQVVDAGLPIPSPEHEALILLCQCAWAGKAKASYRKRLRALVSNNAEATRVTEFLSSRFRFDHESLSRLVAGGTTDELRSCFRRSPNRQERIHNISSLITRSVKRILEPPGIVIDCPGLPDEAITAMADRLELLFPRAKASRGSDPTLRIFLSMFRGGIVWGDTPNNRIAMMIARCWGGKRRSFRLKNGMILHMASGQSSTTESSPDFIGYVLANYIARSL